MTRCPGQDQRYWTPDDIFDVCCPYCDYEIEFWKDEPYRLCRSCQKEVRNPRIDLGCAKWCKFADQCLGRSVDDQLAAAPVITKLKTIVKTLMTDNPERYDAAMEIYRVANLLLTSEGGDPSMVKPVALLVSIVRDDPAPLEMAMGILDDTVFGKDEKLAVCSILSDILDRRHTDALDGAVVSDAIILAESGLDNEVEQGRLVTEGAKMIYALRLNKRDKNSE